MAVIATTFVWGIWRLGNFAHRHATASAAGRWWLRIVYGLSLAVILTVGLLWVTARPVPTSTGNAIERRLFLMQNGALLARDTLFTGIGPGMFEMHFSIYALLIHVGFIGHSHNVLVDMALEQGLLGAVAYATILATTVLEGAHKLVMQARQRDSDPSPQNVNVTPLLLEAALAAFIITCLHGLVDDALYGSRALIFLLMPLGLAQAAGQLLPLRVCTRLSSRTPAPGDGGGEHCSREVIFLRALRGDNRTCKLIQHLGVTALPILLTIILIMGIVGAQQRRTGTWLQALQATWHANLGAVAQARIELDVYDQRHFDDPTMDDVRRQEDLSQAVAHFQRALALNGANPTARQRLTEILLARYEYEPAMATMQRAWEAGYRDRITRLLYGDALVATGHVREAVDIAQGLQFAQARLLGQAWSRYHQAGDAEREAYARQAAAQLRE